MFSSIRSFWSPPEFADSVTNDQARCAFLLARLLVFVSLGLSVVLSLLDYANSLPLIVIALLWSAGFVIIMELVRRDRLHAATWAIPGLMITGVPLLVLIREAPLDVLTGSLLLAVAVATLLLGIWGAVVYGGLGVLLTLGFLGLDGAFSGRLEPQTFPGTVHGFLLAGMLVTAAMVIGVIARQMHSVSLRDRKLAEQVSASHDELAGAIATLRAQAESVERTNAQLEQEIAERQRVQAMLQALVAGTASVIGDDFMRSLSLELVHVLQVRYVLISELLDDRVTVRTVVCRDNDKLIENFSYKLEHTPCQEVIQKLQALSIERDVQSLYPLDGLLAEMGCVSYYAEPLLSSAPGVVLGHLAMLDVKPLIIDEDQRMLVKIFAARTSAELERNRAELALLDERRQLAQRVEERTAELLETNRELSRALQHRNEFLANVSHELRTPLNVVIGLTDALSEGVYGALNERQVRSLTTVNQSGRHLLMVINDILDVAKLEAGQILLRPADIPVRELCQTCIESIRPKADSKGITVHFRCDERATTVWADSTRMRQVLLNLLSNAVKFTEDQGEIGIDVTVNEDATNVDFAVWDVGIGISAEDIPRLYQPFVQLDARLNRRFGGTGLGLVIVKRIVELHHGSISVESALGQGSRFVVSLPISTESAQRVDSQVVA